jgi:hypothetical protein
MADTPRVKRSPTFVTRTISPANTTFAVFIQGDDVVRVIYVVGVDASTEVVDLVEREAGTFTPPLTQTPLLLGMAREHPTLPSPGTT